MSTSIGVQAETAAAEYLQQLGYEIKDRNWRTPLCEIDIVAQKTGRIHFVEVKYRSRDGQGGGLEYITPQKLRQMEFAARCWSEENNWQEDCELAAIEVSANFTISAFLPTLTG